MLRLATALVVAAAAPAQSTWVVDHQGGPGVDFVTVQAAVDAAADGDRILVAAGTYHERLDVDKAVVIVGTRGPSPQSSTRVAPPGTVPAHRLHGVHAGGVLALCDLTLDRVEVDGTAGLVVLDDVTLASLHANGARDLRASRLRSAQPALSIPGPRVDLVDCRAELVDVESNVGVRAAAVTATARGDERLHVALPELQGTHAFFFGDPLGCLSSTYSDPGLAALGTMTTLVTGDGEGRVAGGMGHSSPFCAQGDSGSSGIFCCEGSLRLGPVTVVSGGAGAAIELCAGASLTTPARRDPSLTLVGSPAAGAVVWLKSFGEPGDSVSLHLGRRADRAQGPPASPVERLTSENRTVTLGTVPANGVVRTPLPIPASLPRGLVFFLQVSTVDAVGEVRYSNSFAVIVR